MKINGLICKIFNKERVTALDLIAGSILGTMFAFTVAGMGFICVDMCGVIMMSITDCIKLTNFDIPNNITNVSIITVFEYGILGIVAAGIILVLISLICMGLNKITITECPKYKK